MKKIYSLAFFIAFQFSFSQIALTKLNGTPIVNGDVLAVNQTGYPAGEIGFKIRNTGTTTTRAWVKCQALVNNTGSNFQLCFGEECLADVVLNQVYPSTAVTLAPNATNGNFDHFLNNNTVGTVFPQDYVFRFFQTNQVTQGGAEVGNSITMTYRYNPNLSADEILQLQNSGVIIKSTVVSTILELDVLKNVTISIFNLNGSIIHNANLNYGMHDIDCSSWSAGIYLVKFVTEEGRTSSKKIVVQ